MIQSVSLKGKRFLFWLSAAMVATGSLLVMGLDDTALQLGESTHVDYYDYYRRMKVDLCKTLPTLAEVNAVESYLGGDTSALDIEQEIDDCLNSDAFSELLGLWIDDFILPHSGIGVDPTNHRFLAKSSVTFELNGGGTETIEYYYDPRSGSLNTDYVNNCGSLAYLGCRESGGGPGGGMFDVCDESYKASFESILETVETPYFQRDPVYVCPGLKWYETPADVPDTAVYSGINTGPMMLQCPGNEGTVCPNERCETVPDPIGESWYCFKGYPTENDSMEAQYLRMKSGGQYCPQAPNLQNQCSCGPNLIWCMVKDEEDTDDALKLVLDQALRDEPSDLVEYIVQNNIDFRDIFNADYSVRSKRAQHFIESNMGIDPTLSEGGRAVENFFIPSPGGAIVDPDLDTPAYQSFTAAMQDEDGDQIESGLITSYVFLKRQPTQPNRANTIYRFWTCDEVTPRIQGYDLIHDDVLSDGGTMVANTNDKTMPPVIDTQLAYYSPEVDLTDTDVSTYDADTGTDGYLVSPLYLDPGPNDVITSYQAGDEAYAECYSCHVTVNPLAAFSNRWDDEARYLPISQEGVVANITLPAFGVFAGKQGHDLSGLGDLLAESQDVIDCIIQRTYQLLTGTPLEPSRYDELETLRDDFRDGSGRLADSALSATPITGDSYNIKNLYKSIILSESYRRGF